MMPRSVEMFKLAITPFWSSVDEYADVARLPDYYKSEPC